MQARCSVMLESLVKIKSYHYRARFNVARSRMDESPQVCTLCLVDVLRGTLVVVDPMHAPPFLWRG